VTFDQDLHVFALVEAVEVTSESGLRIASDVRLVEVKVDLARCTRDFDTCPIFALFISATVVLGSGATRNTFSLAGAGVFTNLLGIRTVGVFGTNRWFGHTHMTFTNFARITITWILSICITDEATAQSIGVTAFGRRTYDISASLLYTSVPFTLLSARITTIHCGTALLAFVIDTIEFLFAGIVAFIGSAVFIRFTLWPRITGITTDTAQ
tara:strand:- start:5952 stop:6584 length:633 start_codon:yes stop_codon:yes gene_type:complete